MPYNFCMSQLTIALKLHNFIAFHRKIMYEGSGEKKLFAADIT